MTTSQRLPGSSHCFPFWTSGRQLCKLENFWTTKITAVHTSQREFKVHFVSITKIERNNPFQLAAKITSQTFIGPTKKNTSSPSIPLKTRVRFFYPKTDGKLLRLERCRWKRCRPKRCHPRIPRALVNFVGAVVIWWIWWFAGDGHLVFFLVEK